MSCPLCGLPSEECDGTCANATYEPLPPSAVYAQLSMRSRKQASRNVFQWPEWKALAARLGVSNRPLRKVVVTLACDAVALVEETFIGLDTCPTHPSDTPHTASHQALSEAEITPTPAASVDTPHDGDANQDGSSKQR